MVPYGIGEREERPAAAQNRELTQGKKLLLNRCTEGVLIE